MSQKVDLRADYIAVSYVTEGGRHGRQLPGPAEAGRRHDLRLGRYAPHDGRAARGQRPAVVLARDAAVLPGRGPGPRPDCRSRWISRSTVRSGRFHRRASPPTSSALGLSIPTDENTFDWENRLFPRARDPGAELLIHESFLAFPNIKPFANPAVLGPTELADSLYQTPVYLLFSQGPPTKFQFRLRYNSSGAGDRTTLNLNALQILEGSEKLYLGGRLLHPRHRLHHRLRNRVDHVPQPRGALRQRGGADHGAVRGARHLRGGADVDLRPHHAL